MVLARTARGAVSDKSDGTTLSIPNVTMPQGESLVVFVAGESVPDSVTHAGRTLRLKSDRQHPTEGFGGSLWLKSEYRREKTGDIVATWGSTTGKRAMVASSLDSAQRRDRMSWNDEDNSVSPTTGRAPSGTVVATALVIGTRYAIDTLGTTDWTSVGASSNTIGEVFVATAVGAGDGIARPTLTGDTDMVLAFFVSEGPSTDHSGATARIDDGAVWTAATIGQVAGTTGAGARSNLTVTEAFLQLNNPHATRAQMQGADSRDWVSGLIALRSRTPWHRQGITPSDIAAVDSIVEAAGGDVDNIYYQRNPEGEWEAYEAGTLRATRDEDTGTWS